MFSHHVTQKISKMLRMKREILILLVGLFWLVKNNIYIQYLYICVFIYITQIMNVLTWSRERVSRKNRQTSYMYMDYFPIVTIKEVCSTLLRSISQPQILGELPSQVRPMFARCEDDFLYSRCLVTTKYGSGLTKDLQKSHKGTCQT